MRLIQYKYQIALAKYSLALLWIFTALTSIFLAPEIGYQILAKANIEGEIATMAIYSGSLLDMLLGIWLLTGKRLNLCCQLQIILILIYSFLISLIDYHYWLHPFAPIIKNIPILVLIYWLGAVQQNN